MRLKPPGERSALLDALIITAVAVKEVVKPSKDPLPEASAAERSKVGAGAYGAQSGRVIAGEPSAVLALRGGSATQLADEDSTLAP